MIEIDLHGFELVDAKTEIIFAIKEHQDESTVLIIHGYNQGQVLRSYIRSDRFKQDMKKQGIIVNRISDQGDKEGTTTFSFTIIEK